MGYKLLLADDSITIQKVVGIIFANENYELTVVDNGNAALEQAKEIQPDVILVDALMPGKSGYDVCREVRQVPAIKDIPLLLLVGAFEPFDEEKARNSGADDHISKPFESQHLIEKVKKLIELGEERAKTRVRSDTTAYAAASDGPVNIKDELLSEMETGLGLSAAITDEEDVREKPADFMCLDSLDMVEALPQDDLWGVFEVEDVAECGEVHLGEIIEEDEFEPEIINTVEEIEPFVFKEEGSTPFGNEIAASVGEFPETGSDSENEADECFVFNEEPEFAGSEDFAPAEPSIEITEVASLTIGEDIDKLEPEVSGFIEVPPTSLHAIDAPPSSEPPSLHTVRGLQFASVEENVSSPDILSGERGMGAAGVPENTISLSEEQLTAILARVSKEIIEKIAWEVVPDLAETIIREEIRKIKEGY